MINNNPLKEIIRLAYAKQLIRTPKQKEILFENSLKQASPTIEKLLQMSHNLNNDIVLQKSWHGLTPKAAVAFPSVVAVRAILTALWRSMRKDGRETYLYADGSADECAEGMDIRLQVRENGQWQINCGLSDYDCDHRGFWGSSSIPFDRSNLTHIAKDLIEQAKDHCASSGFSIYREKR